MKIYKMAASNPTNLFELRRFLVPGKKLKLTYHANPKAQPNVGQIREIVSKKGNDVGILTDGNVSFLPLSDSDHVHYQFTNNGFSIAQTENNRVLMTYEYVNEPS